jgi:hypothetical protein
MKNLFRSANQVKNLKNSFSNFSEENILSNWEMNCVRGGDGGDELPPHPKP